MALFGFGKKNIDPAEAGQKAFEKNNIPEALRLWRISAETGHAGAIHALYSSVKEGWLPEYDKDTVRLLLKLAGEAGNTEAMDKVSGLYMGGYGVQKDREEGLRWKVKAAELGHFQAAYDLADSYFTGYRVSVDVEKDYEKALFWAKKALPLVQEDADKKGEINHIIWKCETELGLYKLGMIAFNAGDYTEALTRFSGVAEKGDTEAAKALYTMYLTGRGVAKDEKKAFGWKLKAAELGDPDAMFDVAADYLLEREGMERDLDKALFWAEKVKQAQEGKKPDKPRDVDRLVAACRDAKRIDSFNRGLDAYKKEAYPEALACFKDAADLGDTGAMYNLFVMYQNGIGTEKDERKAFRYAEKAAEENHPDAMVALSIVFFQGNDSTKKNPVQSLLWAKKAKQAQDEGKLDKKYDVDGMIEKCRKALEQDPLNSGLAIKKAGDFDEAFRLFMLAAEAGSAKAAFFVSVMYQEGEGVEKDEEESFRWEEKAAELGDPDSMFILAHAYSGGKNVVEKDLSKALFWAKKAEQARDGGALFNFADGEGLIRKIERDIAYDAARAALKTGDCDEAIRQFMRAAELGSSEAADTLAMMYANGKCTPKDDKEAFRWRIKAAELGNADAMYIVAGGYFLGKYGAEADNEKALFWAKKAKQAQEEGKLDKKYDLDELIRQLEQTIAFDAATVARRSGDYAEAIRQYKRAAELGVSQAAHNLAVMYETGDGVEKDEKEAFRWRIKAAELGRPDDMYVVALGYGDNRDFTQALFWAKKAKQAQEEGKLDKQIDVDGLIRKIEQDIAFDAATVAWRSGDYAEAIRQFTRAAELGSAAAAHNLAAMYNTGKGVPKDEKESFRWSVNAAELGNPDDMFVVAYSCFYGKYGAERDLKQALLWAKKAIQAQENGKLNNQFNIDKLIRDIEKAAASDTEHTTQSNRISAEDIQDFRHLTFLSSVKVAEHANSDLMYYVAFSYFHGENGAEEDLTQALFWAKKAKQTQEEGNFVQKRDVEGLIREIEQEIAFKAGSDASENGDYAEALKQYTRAVELSADAESNSVLAIGGAMAAHNISSLYYNGNGVALDKKEGFRWNLKAAELGLPGAMFSVGWQYYNGKEIEKDLAKALFWAKKAKQTYEEGLFDKDMPVDDLIKLIEKDMR